MADAGPKNRMDSARKSIDPRQKIEKSAGRGGYDGLESFVDSFDSGQGKLVPRWQRASAREMSTCWLTPMPKQQEFLDLMSPEIGEDRMLGFGGGFGGGKTAGCVIGVIESALRFPGFLWMLGRDSMKDFENFALYPFIIPLCEAISAKYGLRFVQYKTDEYIQFHNKPGGAPGSVLQLKPTSKPGTLRGGNIDGIWVNEAIYTPRSVFYELLARWRGSPSNPIVIEPVEPGTEAVIGDKRVHDAIAKLRSEEPNIIHESEEVIAVRLSALLHEAVAVRKRHGWPLRFIWDSNPGPGWPKDWADDARTGRLGTIVRDGKGDRDLRHWFFVNVKSSDNTTLRANYGQEAMAADKSGNVKKMYDGDWEEIPGLVYQIPPMCWMNFDPCQMFGVGNPVEVCESGSYDWGSTHDTAIMVGFVFSEALFDEDPIPRLYIWDAYVEDGADLSAQIEWIRGYSEATFFADQSIWYNDKQSQTQRAIAVEFDEAGIEMAKANTGAKYNVLAGIKYVQRLLKARRIIFHSRLEKVRVALERFHWEPNPEEPGQFTTKACLEGEDVGDVLRYLALNVSSELQVNILANKSEGGIQDGESSFAPKAKPPHVLLKERIDKERELEQRNHHPVRGELVQLDRSWKGGFITWRR